MTMENHVLEARVIGKACRRQDSSLWKMGADQALALQRRPGGRIAEAGRILPGDDGIAQMEVVAMRRRDRSDEN